MEPQDREVVNREEADWDETETRPEAVPALGATAIMAAIGVLSLLVILAVQPVRIDLFILLLVLLFAGAVLAAGMQRPRHHL